ncbi:MAG: hypothetical protein ACPLRW_13110 [Moorellales bacterium]
MGAIDCARAILKYVSDRDTAVTFVAIAGAESGWRLDARGDCGNGSWSCNGCCSWGPWQVNICAHYPWLKDVVGSTDPCAIARWLTASYDNSARAAATVKARQGFCAWTVYEKWCSPRHNGRYRDFLDEARQAVDAALAEQPQPPPQPQPYPPTAAAIIPVAAALASVALGGAGVGLLLFANRERVKSWWYNLTRR